MKMNGWGGKMKSREEWRQIVQEAKAHPELQRRGERRKFLYVSLRCYRYPDNVDSNGTIVDG
jgi:hypothetical protein